MRKSIGLIDFKQHKAQYDGLREYSEIQEIREKFQKAKMSLPLHNFKKQQPKDYSSEAYFCEPSSIFRRKQRTPSLATDSQAIERLHKRHNFEALKAVRREMEKNEEKCRVLKNQCSIKSVSGKFQGVRPPLSEKKQRKVLTHDPQIDYRNFIMLPRKHNLDEILSKYPSNGKESATSTPLPEYFNYAKNTKAALQVYLSGKKRTQRKNNNHLSPFRNIQDDDHSDSVSEVNFKSQTPCILPQLRVTTTGYHEVNIGSEKHDPTKKMALTPNGGTRSSSLSITLRTPKMETSSLQIQKDSLSLLHRKNPVLQIPKKAILHQ